MGKLERGWAGYRAITVDDYTWQPSQEEEQELQDRQQQREEGRATRRVWEEGRKERARELYIKRGELEEEFETWWEERRKERQRVYKSLKERRREGRKIKKIGERWTEW
jgi:hypothetical protein